MSAALKPMRGTLVFILVGFGVAAPQRPAFATKPCLPSPCETRGAIDLPKCQSLADWIAIGTITHVVHHEQGYPLLKDFAEFTFTAEKWEKGSGKAGAELQFQVGWCENSQPLPKDTTGKFRFFGLPLPKDPSLPNQYLLFEPVKAAIP